MSNVVESANITFKVNRGHLVLDLLDYIWLYFMEIREQRLTTAHSDCVGVFTPWAIRRRVFVRNETEAGVRQTNDKIYNMNLETRNCDCRHFGVENLSGAR